MAAGERHDRYKKGKLSAKTIKNYTAFISVVFEFAKRQQVITFNPCSTVTLPKDEYKEKEIYTVEEIQQILELLYQEDKKNFQFVVYFVLAVYTGFRRGELLGLEFKDIDYDRQIVSVKRTSNYTKSKGLYSDTPKTKNSYRTLRLPLELINLLRQYQAHQAEYAESLGNQWHDNDRLFTQWNGLPMFTNSPSLYFGRFCERHGLRYLNIHSIRHLNASIQVLAGVDVKAIQISLGHSQASTTLNLYCHAFQQAQALAMDGIVNVIGLPQRQLLN
jgi:integrase